MKKRIVSILLSAVMLLSLSGCGVFGLRSPFEIILDEIKEELRDSDDASPEDAGEPDEPDEKADAPAQETTPAPETPPEDSSEKTGQAPQQAFPAPRPHGDVSSWVTTASGETVANGVEQAASLGLLSSVSIFCTYTEETTISGGGSYYGFPFGFGMSPYGGGEDRTQEEETESAGSGIIYWLDKAGGDAYVVTNYHVVYNKNCNTPNLICDDISVFLYGSERSDMAIPAEYVGGSMYYDIAVLKITDSEILRNSSANVAVFTDSSLVSAGQTAIAIGNAEAGGIAVTSGVVSVPSEYINMTATDEMTALQLRVMRIDTAVNSGNSGGGLFDDAGHVIGIVNAKIMTSNVENIGYAIPSNIVRAIADNIISNCDGTDVETVQRGLLGITVTTSESHAVYDAETGKTIIVETVYVDSVNEGGAADGLLQADDVILAITVDGVRTEATRQYSVVDAMLAASVGSEVVMEVSRGGSETSVTIPIGADDVQSY